MADFNSAFQKTLDNEGGYLLHKVEGDTGGWTYAGIAENYWPDWEGWALVKGGREEETHDMVQAFYKKNFWDKIKGDAISSNKVAYNIYDFGVNAGIKTSAKLAQEIASVAADGVIGPMSLGALNSYDEKLFELKFAMAKIQRYAAIVNRKRSQSKFLLGWINRTLNVLKDRS